MTGSREQTGESDTEGARFWSYGPTPDPATWACKIGEVDRSKLPDGADRALRTAIMIAYVELTGEHPRFVFSGWGAELDEVERGVVNDE